MALALLLAAPPGASTQQGTDALGKLVPPVPTPASFVADVPNILPPAQHALIDTQIRAMQAAGLGDLGIAILPSIGNYDPNTVAVAIYRSWHIGSVAAIGSAHRNVGVFLLIVPKELAPDKKGQCYILTGTGAEGIVTDAASGEICRDIIIPRLIAKDYAGAIKDGITAIAARLTDDPGLRNPATSGEVKAPSQSSGPFHWWQLPIALVTLLAGVLGTKRWNRNRTRKCPKCGKPMTKLSETAEDAQLAAGQRTEEKLQSVDYDVWECTCGEHLVIPYPKLFTKYSKCRECHARTAWSTRRILFPATTMSAGSAEDTWRCEACKATWVTQVILPRIVQSSSSSGGGGGGGGGGSSFGGSGSTSGGGGGGSY